VNAVRNLTLYYIEKYYKVYRRVISGAKNKDNGRLICAKNSTTIM
jgi:hypothetical protein